MRAAKSPFAAAPGKGLALALVALFVALSLAGCGKRNAPVPPPGAKITYPRSYPSE
jgi:predicted small lipoprotein YifL